MRAPTARRRAAAAAARWRAWRCPCCAWRATSGDPSGPARPTSASKDASNMTDRFQRPVGPGAAATTGGTGAGALPRMFRTSRWSSTNGLRCRHGPDRGGNAAHRAPAGMQHPDFSLQEPQPRAQPVFSYCSANPGAFHRADAAAGVFWADRVIEIDAINPQVAVVAPGARAGPLAGWPSPTRSAAREAIAARGRQAAKRPEQRRARGRHRAPGPTESWKTA